MASSLLWGFLAARAPAFRVLNAMTLINLARYFSLQCNVCFNRDQPTRRIASWIARKTSARVSVPVSISTSPFE